MNTSERLTDLEVQSREHTLRLIGIEDAFKSLGNDVRGLTDEMKLLVTTVTKQEARPKWEMHKLLTIMASAIVIFASIASGIIYVAGNVSSPAATESRLRLEFLEQRLDNNWFKKPVNVTTITKRSG